MGKLSTEERCGARNHHLIALPGMVTQRMSLEPSQSALVDAEKSDWVLCIGRRAAMTDLVYVQARQSLV